MWFQNSNLADYPLLRYAGQLFGDGLISSLSSQEAGAVLTDLDRLWQQHSREIARIGMSWWKRALLPPGPRTTPSAHQIHENRLRVLEWANNSYAPAELFLYRVETIATDPAHFNLVAALKIPAAVIRSSLDRWEYERHLMRLTRAECRDVLGKIQWQMSTRVGHTSSSSTIISERFTGSIALRL